MLIWLLAFLKFLSLGYTTHSTMFWNKMSLNVKRRGTSHQRIDENGSIISNIIIVDTGNRGFKTGSDRSNSCRVCKNRVCQVIDNRSSITTQNGWKWRQIKCDDSIHCIDSTCSNIAWLISKIVDYTLETSPSCFRFEQSLLRIRWSLQKRTSIKRMTMFVTHCTRLIFLIKLTEIIG